MIVRQFHIGLYVALVIVMMMSCSQQKTSLVLEEGAPVQVMKNTTIQSSDSGRLQMIMWGEEIWNFDDEEQTQEFPSNVKATFFDRDGNVSTVITANEATNWQRKKLMNLRGNVVIVDLRDGKTTYTEDFFWDQDKGEVYSNVYVLQIGKDGTRTEGTGFRADEQMHEFNIFNFRVTMPL